MLSSIEHPRLIVGYHGCDRAVVERVLLRVDLYQRTLLEVAQPLPRNRPTGPRDHDLLLRNLDCAVINFAMRESDVGRGSGSPF